MINNRTNSLLLKIERVGNKLPHPIYIFLILSIIISFLSFLLSGIKFSSPSGELYIKNIISLHGMEWFIKNFVKNFALFPPLATVIAMSIGISIAEETGLIKAALKILIINVKSKKFVTFIVVFSGVLGNVAGSSTFAIIPPLGGMIFKTMKRNPIVGVLAGFAGVSAGLSANVLITPTDVLLTSITQKSVNLLNPSLNISVACNWFFMFASTFLLSIVGTIVIEKFIEPRFSSANDNDYTEDEKHLNYIEVNGLKYVLFTTIIYIIILFLFVNNLIISGIVPFLILWFLLIGILYGKLTGKIKNLSDIENMMTNSIKNISGFIVICFFASQFIEIFSYTNLGVFISVLGSEWLLHLGIVGVPIIIIFIIFTTFINILIGSSSAKWALLAPIFIPMFMNIGISPIVTQAAYRIADSVSNCISPLEPFMPFIIIICKKYDDKIGMGTIITWMFPIAISFIISWTLLLLIWYQFNIPLGL